MMPAQIVLEGDTARVHRDDPVTSHLAADKSQASVQEVRANILHLIRSHGPLAAFEVCDLYARAVATFGWRQVHHETPRKRMSDMKRDGLLVNTGAKRINREGSPESVVALKELAEARKLGVELSKRGDL